MREQIITLAKKLDADLIGFAPAERFSEEDAVFRILPETKTVIGLGFRVLRGIYRGVEEGTTYYQYTTMGVENLEETVMPLALLQLSNFIEEQGFLAVPQRKNQLIMREENETNPEVDYSDIYRGIRAENQPDFLRCAVACGLGEESKIHSLLTDDFGPFVRYCFILTDMELAPTPLQRPHLCDGCDACMKACPGHAIGADGETDSWRCAVYYNGACGGKNPFMPPDAFLDFEEKKRMEIIHGNAQFDADEAKDILDHIYFYPPAKHFYRVSICGRACDRACYMHLEEKGLLKRKFCRPFREKEDWTLSYAQFEKKESTSCKEKK